MDDCLMLYSELATVESSALDSLIKEERILNVSSFKRKDILQHFTEREIYIKYFNTNFLSISPVSSSICSIKYSENGPDLALLKPMSFFSMIANSHYSCETEEYIKPEPKDMIRDIIDKRSFYDIIVDIGKTQFFCHVLVLKAYSKLFQQFQYEIRATLPVEQVTPKAFTFIYDWMIEDHYQVPREIILEVFQAAIFLDVEELIGELWQYFDHAYFYEANAFVLYWEAIKFPKMEKQRELMLSRIYRFFLTLVGSEEFLQMPCKDVCHLLKSNTIGINNEVEIFMTALRWLRHNWNKRESDIVQIMSCVRYGLLPAWFLLSLNKQKQLASLPNDIVLSEVINNEEVSRFLAAGLSYATICMHYKPGAIELDAISEKIFKDVPNERYWIYHKDCPYHNAECGNSPLMEETNYEVFLAYLNRLQHYRDYSYLNLIEKIESEPTMVKKVPPAECSFEDSESDSDTIQSY